MAIDTRAAREITTAIATGRSKDRNPDRLFDAAKALVTLNVGD